MRVTKLLKLWLQLLPVILLAAALQAHVLHPTARQYQQADSFLKADLSLRTVTLQYLIADSKISVNQYAVAATQSNWPALIVAATQRSPEPFPHERWPAQSKLRSYWNIIAYQHFKASLA